MRTRDSRMRSTSCRIRSDYLPQRTRDCRERESTPRHARMRSGDSLMNSPSVTRLSEHSRMNLLSVTRLLEHSRMRLISSDRSSSRERPSSESSRTDQISVMM